MQAYGQERTMLTIGELVLTPPTSHPTPASTPHGNNVADLTSKIKLALHNYKTKRDTKNSTNRNVLDASLDNSTVSSYLDKDLSLAFRQNEFLFNLENSLLKFNSNNVASTSEYLICICRKEVDENSNTFKCKTCFYLYHEACCSSKEICDVCDDKMDVPCWWSTDACFQLSQRKSIFNLGKNFVKIEKKLDALVKVRNDRDDVDANLNELRNQLQQLKYLREEDSATVKQHQNLLAQLIETIKSQKEDASLFNNLQSLISSTSAAKADLDNKNKDAIIENLVKIQTQIDHQKQAIERITNVLENKFTQDTALAASKAKGPFSSPSHLLISRKASKVLAFDDEYEDDDVQEIVEVKQNLQQKFEEDLEELDFFAVNPRKIRRTHTSYNKRRFLIESDDEEVENQGTATTTPHQEYSQEECEKSVKVISSMHRTERVGGSSRRGAAIKAAASMRIFY